MDVNKGETINNYFEAFSCYTIGNSDKFAIQFGVDRVNDTNGTKHFSGSIVYWLNGDCLGDWNYSVYLNAFYSHFHTFLYGSGALHRNDNLFKMDFDSILKSMRRKYSIEFDESMEKFDDDYYSVAVGICTNSLEGASIIFLDQDTTWKVRYWEIKETTDTYGELELEKDYFEKVLKSFMHFFDTKLLNT